MIRSCCTARIGPHTCNIDRRLQNFSCRDAHKVAKDLSLGKKFLLAISIQCLALLQVSTVNSFLPSLLLLPVFVFQPKDCQREREKEEIHESAHQVLFCLPCPSAARRRIDCAAGRRKKPPRLFPLFHGSTPYYVRSSTNCRPSSRRRRRFLQVVN